MPWTGLFTMDKIISFIGMITYLNILGLMKLILKWLPKFILFAPFLLIWRMRDKL